LTDARQPFLVHAHCHQKAMGADKSIAKVLGMIPNADVDPQTPRLIGHFRRHQLPA